MTTNKQKLGDFGEQTVVETCTCPACNQQGTYGLLPKNQKLVDVVCSNCGAVAQVKAKRVKNLTRCPKTVLGAAWGPQRKQLEEGIFNTLFVVLVNEVQEFAVYCLPAEDQTAEMYRPRKPLSQNARRAGWQGFVYDMTQAATPATIVA